MRARSQDIQFSISSKRVSVAVGCGAAVAGQSRSKIINLTFTDSSLHHVEVRLLPELVALTEVGAEVVLVLHHVPGDGQADGRIVYVLCMRG